MLVARDGDDTLLDEKDDWVRAVIVSGSAFGSSKLLIDPTLIVFISGFRRHCPFTFSSHVTVNHSRSAAFVKGPRLTLTSAVSVAFIMKTASVTLERSVGGTDAKKGGLPKGPTSPGASNE
jgi:hypothetical protein